nr:DUF3786 domain-containing protein [Anaerolineae bacterium]
MLQQGNTPQLQQWLDRLAPVVEEARETLRRLKPGKLAMYSGCEQDADGNFHLTFFWQEYVIAGRDFTVRRADTGEEPSSFTQSLILTYLATADGTTPSGRWVGFRDLPDGLFYAQAFQGYTGDRLVRELRGGVETFRRAAEALGGEPLEIGDAGYAFTVLPRVRLAVVYWEGDEEFPSQARVLFEDTAANYMPTDGLAILGSQLVGRILKAAG